MKLVLVLLSAFILSGAAQAQEPPLAGGYQERPVTDRGVVAAANFAVREQGRREGTPVSLLSVKRAETQVVAGLNYRLLLSVRVRGEVRDARAVVYQNLGRTYSLSSWQDAGEGGAADASRSVKVYLVALDDGGKAGRKIGCGDSLVPVERSVSAAPSLKTAVEELLAVPHEYEGRLGNYWWGENLKVRDASIRRGTATIRISGKLYVAGVCDEPRIEEQIKETARQFSGVRRVKVFVNGRPLSQAIR